MKQILLTTALLITTVLAFAQAPQGINYQAVVRDAGGNELANQAVSLRMTILENNTTTVYQETHSATTNDFGLVNLVIGQGAATQGTFNTIDWSTGNYFAQTEVDVSGGTNYSLMGSQQLMSVPYALYAETSGGGNSVNVSVSQTGDTIYFGNGQWIVLPNASNANAQGTMTDCDNNLYQTVVIGNQEWMAENMRATCYSNGDEIPNVTNGSEWGSLQSGGWCYYDNDSQYDAPYGKLYNAFALQDSRELCPTGWHAPNLEEWQELIDYLGGTSTAGGAMKQAGTQYWNTPNTGATNSSGFNGLPASTRGNSGTFGTGGAGIGYFNRYWATTGGGQNIETVTLTSSSSGATTGTVDDNIGLSIRCIKD